MSSLTVDRSIWLGDPSDPKPVFRDEAKDGATWPEGAAFAVTFTAEAFPGYGWRDERGKLPRTEYYNAEGWPLELEQHLKASQPERIRHELQVFPWSWWRFSNFEWESHLRDPEFLTMVRAYTRRDIHNLADALVEEHCVK